MPDVNGWISVDERRPTREDADGWGAVLWWNDAQSWASDCSWETDNEYLTHWQPLPRSPVKKVKKTLKLWVNLYPEGKISARFTREKADDDAAGFDRIACVYMTGEYEVEE